MFRLAKRCESWFFQAADAVVTLTHASLPRIRRLMSSRDVPVVVIPTCVDLQRFSGSKTRADGPHLVWCGSIGTWYRFDLVPGLARALDWQLEVVTRQVDLAFDQLGELGANVRTLSPAEVPDVMCEGDVGLSLCKDVLAMQAMAPTRFAEYMASGMSVVVTPGLGDVERLVEEHRVGVILRGEDEAAFRNAAVAIRALQADPALPGRCLALARECFDVEAGTRAYAALYDHLLRRDR